MKAGDRVVIARGSATGRRGTIVAFDEPTKPYGKRSIIEGDDGERYYFQDYEANAFFAEDSPEAAPVLANYAAALGAPDLAADTAFVAQVTAAKNSPLTGQALDRIARHGAAGAEALLDLVAYQLQELSARGKPPGWIPPSLRALAAMHGDAVPATSVRVQRWYADPATRPLVARVTGAFGNDPAVVELLRALCASIPEAERSERTYAELVHARRAAGDPTVYPDLADVVVKRRTNGDGWVIAVGALTPAQADEVLAVVGDRAVVAIDVQAGSVHAYGGFDLARWLAWPGLARFPRVIFATAFTGEPALAAVLASPHLAPELVALSFAACDLGQKACGRLGKSARLARLRELVLDRGDYDRSKFDRKCLDALFPAKGGALTKLEQLSIRGSTVTADDVRAVVAAGRAPALRTVQLSRELVELAR